MIMMKIKIKMKIMAKLKSWRKKRPGFLEKKNLASSFFSSSKAAVAAAMRAKLYLSRPHKPRRGFTP